MDILDLKILNCLKSNSRMNATTIGKRVNLSTSSVIERIHKMEAQNIIEKYPVLVDYKSIGKDITAFMSVNLEHPRDNDVFRERILELNDVAECHYLAGDFDYVLKVITASSQTLEKTLNAIKSIPGVFRTRTLVVLSTIKNETTVLPDDI